MLTIVSSKFYEVRGRVCITWQPKGWPAGFITGFYHNPGFVVEHMTVFARATLHLMIPEFLGLAREKRLMYLETRIPHNHIWQRALVRVISRYGFKREDADPYIGVYRLWL